MQSMVYILYDSCINNCLTYCAQNVSLVVMQLSYKNIHHWLPPYLRYFAPVSDNSRSINVYTIRSAYSAVFIFSYTTQHIATSLKFVFLTVVFREPQEQQDGGHIKLSKKGDLLNLKVDHKGELACHQFERVFNPLLLMLKVRYPALQNDFRAYFLSGSGCSIEFKCLSFD